MNTSRRLKNGIRRPQSLLFQGFTLIELLVVIAIIGILAAITIPVIGQVRATAQSSVCVSNLREIGKACQLYAGENKNRLPQAITDGATWPTNLWSYKINPYLEKKKTGEFPTILEALYNGTFRCPSKTDWGLQGDGIGDVQRVSYSMSTFSNTTSGREMLLTKIPDPTRTLLVAEIRTGQPGFWNLSNLYTNPALRHRERDNMLFCDGHVEAVGRDKLAENLPFLVKK